MLRCEMKKDKRKRLQQMIKSEGRGGVNVKIMAQHEN